MNTKRHARIARCARASKAPLRFEAKGIVAALAALVSSLLLPMPQAYAQAIRVTAANSANSAVYDVNFSGTGGSITTLNTDQSAHVSLRSLTFRPNLVTGQLDLLIADTSRGEILLYAGAIGAAQDVWTPSMGVANPLEGTGPLHPNGLSVDAAGNLFVTSSAPGASTTAELWAFSRNPAGPLVGGYELPRLIDNDFGGIAVRLLQESAVTRVAGDFAAPGSLLLLASDPATLFVYRADAVRSVLQGAGQIDPEILLAADQFPAGATPGGFDFWPQDGNLLITTSDGRILRYAAGPVLLPDFASGLGNGKFKIKTGLEFGIPLAFVADNNGGDLLKFGAPPATGNNQPLARVTAGVQSPEGLAVSNTGTALAASCLENAGGCDPLGGVLRHKVRAQTLSGAVIEEPCVLQTDPRIVEFGTCTGHTLVAANYCAGFPHVVIPDYLCGGSGATGRGLALVDTSTQGMAAPSDLVINESDSSSILPGSDNSPCPREVLGWAPKPEEGTIVEGDAMLEMTGGCGSSIGFGRSFSVWGIGLVLNEQALPGATPRDKLRNFAAQKYDRLAQTIAIANIQEKFRKRLQNCIGSSRSQFDRNRLTNALAELLTCDALVVQNRGAFAGSATNPNPFGEVRGRLANLHLTIDTRILDNPASAGWPPGN